jgi:hypothetical protein
VPFLRGGRLRKILIAMVMAIAVFLGVGTFFYAAPAAPTFTYPGGKRFAFSIIDDTDMTTLARVKPIYEVLDRYGVRTTKTVWSFPTNEPDNHTNRGDSLSDPEYRAFIVELQRKGFEIASHGARGGSSRREDTLRGLDLFHETVGHQPRMFVNHSLNKDNLYWGSHLFTIAPLQWLGALLNRHEFSGHDPASPYYWGDIAKARITYVRRYTFPDINLLNVNGSFPYRLDDKPDVNFWFPTANGDRIREFDELLKTEHIERLAREGGVCLVYAHLGAGSFNTKDGKVDPRFEARIRELVKHDGWFVPASQILDHLRQQPTWTGQLGLRERVRLEVRYLAGQLSQGL